MGELIHRSPALALECVSPDNTVIYGFDNLRTLAEFLQTSLITDSAVSKTIIRTQQTAVSLADDWQAISKF